MSQTRQDMRGASLAHAILEGRDLAGIDLTDADLSQARLCGASLQGAILRWVNLQGADLSGCDLRGTDLREADLCEADLRGADLTGAHLEWARWNRSTRFPNGFLCFHFGNGFPPRHLGMCQSVSLEEEAEEIRRADLWRKQNGETA